MVVRRRLSAPVMINLELTSGCNVKCRYCYNFWREENAGNDSRMTLSQMQTLVDMLTREGVFHVVLTGGEPFLNFEVLEFGLTSLHQAGISTSVNSNLMLADATKMERLRKTGLDHVLTSLNSYDAEVSDDVTGRKGAHEKTLRGIRHAIDAGIRVSANMIVSESNRDDVYRTAELCSRLGVQRIFGTRLVPSVNVRNPREWEFNLEKEAARHVLDELIRAKDDFGIAVGSLISYPLCLLQDLEKYADFVGRGCPAQRGNRMVVNADGNAHACTHESTSYGNVFELGISRVFQRMYRWHDGSHIHNGCKECPYVGICRSGCRSAALAYNKSMNGRDPLSEGPASIHTPFRFDLPQQLLAGIDPREPFIVPETIRFREEDGFFVVNIRWANTINVRTEIAKFLRQRKEENRPFTMTDFSERGTHKELLYLLAKEAVLPMDTGMRNRIEKRVKAGCSIDPEDLPEIMDAGCQ